MNDSRRRRRFLRLLALVCVLAAAGFGCGGADGLSQALNGTWEVVAVDDETISGDLTQTWKILGDAISVQTSYSGSGEREDNRCDGSFTLEGVTADRQEATMRREFVETEPEGISAVLGGDSGCGSGDGVIDIRLDGDVLYAKFVSSGGVQTVKLVRR